MKQNLPVFNVGIDIGSTTLKIIVVDADGNIVFSDYRRHHADIKGTAKEIYKSIYYTLGNCELSIVMTGSVGMGYAELLGIKFVQEVVASAALIQQQFPAVNTLVDIGGEDSKMIFFDENKTPDIRMNGSCAGGTGAFIDQMASLLGVETGDLNTLAEKAENIYPIASRCGVFSKTDIQNLISRNVYKSDIVASVFNAVAIQVISSLSRGYDVQPVVFFCGGPFAFLPELRKSFMNLLSLKPEDCILSDNAKFVPAWGCAVLPRENYVRKIRLSQIIYNIRYGKLSFETDLSGRLPALFADDHEFEAWKKKKFNHFVKRADWDNLTSDVCYLGVDSGSTTTKIVVIDKNESVLFQYYARNEGDSFKAFLQGLEAFRDEMHKHNKNLKICGSVATGYGENLIKTAFNLDFGMVETIAHYLAACKISPHVSFILDIGGQDMKAIFIENGAIKRLEINEACSSGCGSFIEGFANMLNYPVAEFAEKSCHSKSPCDLGTRCTVFMNSKVKQAMREGAGVEDIAAGLSYSVVKNCLFKVLKLKNVKELGDHIVVQGGAFRNLSIVRALEQLTGVDVSFSDIPELMGAYGSALYAKENAAHAKQICYVDDMIASRSYSSSFETCTGCENNCLVKSFRFANGNTYYSGNKCEKIYSNKLETEEKGYNLHHEKYNLLFNRKFEKHTKPQLTIGIPRGLNMYENYPFWHTLLEECDIKPVLSARSTMKLYEKGITSLMSDNICFPAKLMHGHVQDLAARKVDRMLFPYAIFEHKEDQYSHNSYNCPVVAGYSDVIKSAIDTVNKYNIPLDSPTVAFNDMSLLYKSCYQYLQSIGVDKKLIRPAFVKAIKEQDNYFLTIAEKARKTTDDAAKAKRMVVLLAGRPYHIDPLVQHKISDCIAEMGVDVITEDVVRYSGDEFFNSLNAISQWAYPNRIFKAANFVANSTDNIHYVQLTSFGCGPDAFILDEVNTILRRKGKNLTVLKIDDVNNIGSLRLRIRSMLESLKFDDKQTVNLPEVTTPAFSQQDKHRKIIAPYFAEGYSEFLPALFKLMDINLEILPKSDTLSEEYGLQYANNEICYPATLVIGDIIKALKSGNYKDSEIAVAITQTGGQCRASNYISMIKNAMIDSGFGHIPVVSVAMGDGLTNEQPGFELKWSKIIYTAMTSLLYADCLNKLYYPALVRERAKGDADRVKQKYLDLAQPLVEKRNRKGLIRLLEQAVEEFKAIIKPNDKIPVVGIVGEIYVKYNSFSNRNVMQWLSEQGVEVVAPSLYNFFINSFVNTHINNEKFIKRTSAFSVFLSDTVYKLVYRYARKFDKVCSSYPYYRPFSNMFEDAEKASEIINLSANFGEGWLIPAEFASFAENGVYDAVSLQPFGCIANHVISKGIEKKVKKIYPNMNLLFIDFDSGVSEANILNRLYFIVESAKRKMEMRFPDNK